jgi:hypothetical protein
LIRAIKTNQHRAARWIDANCPPKHGIAYLYAEAAKCTAEDRSPRTYEWLMWLLERYPPASLDRETCANVTNAVGNNVAHNAAYAWLVDHGFPTLKQARKVLFGDAHE